MPHIENHEVYEDEVRQILEHPGEDRLGSDGCRVALGRTEEGRYLKVVYVQDAEPGSVFVITAYTLKGKALAAYRRRRRRKGG